jgi:hypothetical protein
MKVALLLILLVSLIYAQNKYFTYQSYKGLTCSSPNRGPTRGKVGNCERSGGGYQMTACNGTHVISRGKCSDSNCRSCGIVEPWEIGKCYPIRSVNQSGKYLSCDESK